MSKSVYETIKREYKTRIKTYFQIFRDYENDFISNDEGIEAYQNYYNALSEFASKLNCSTFQASKLLNIGG